MSIQDNSVHSLNSEFDDDDEEGLSAHDSSLSFAIPIKLSPVRRRSGASINNPTPNKPPPAPTSSAPNVLNTNAEELPKPPSQGEKKEEEGGNSPSTGAEAGGVVHRKEQILQCCKPLSLSHWAPFEKSLLWELTKQHFGGTENPSPIWLKTFDELVDSKIFVSVDNHLFNLSSQHRPSDKAPLELIPKHNYLIYFCKQLIEIDAAFFQNAEATQAQFKRNEAHFDVIWHMLTTFDDSDSVEVCQILAGRIGNICCYLLPLSKSIEIQKNILTACHNLRPVLMSVTEEGDTQHSDEVLIVPTIEFAGACLDYARALRLQSMYLAASDFIHCSLVACKYLPTENRILKFEPKEDDTALLLYRRSISSININHLTLQCYTELAQVHLDSMERPDAIFAKDTEEMIAYIKFLFVHSMNLCLDSPRGEKTFPFELTCLIIRAMIGIGTLLGKYSDSSKEAFEYLNKANQHIILLSDKSDHIYVGDVLFALAEIEGRNNNYKKSFELYARAASIYEKQLGHVCMPVAKCESCIAVLLDDAEKFDGALQHYHEAEKILLTCVHPSCLAIADIYLNLGSLYASMNDFDNSKQVLEKAKLIYQSYFGTDNSDVRACLLRLHEISQNPAANLVLDTISDTQIDDDFLKFADIIPENFKDINRILVQAFLMMSVDKLSDAHMLLENVIKLCGKIATQAESKQQVERSSLNPDDDKEEVNLSPTSLLRALTLTMIAETIEIEQLDLTGESSRIKEMFKEAINIYQGVFGEEDVNVANTLIKFGVHLLNSGSFSDAGDAFEEALLILQLYYGGADFRVVAETKLLLARAIAGEEDFPNAIEACEASLAIYKKMYSSKETQHAGKKSHESKDRPAIHTDVAYAMNEMASIYQEQKLFDKAEVNYKKALQMYQQIFKEEPSSQVAQSYNNLGSLYDDQNNFDDAKNMYEKALKELSELYDEDHPQVALVLTNLASLHLGQGDNNVAVPMLTRAVNIYKSLYGEDSSAATEVQELLTKVTSPQGNNSWCVVS